VGRDERPRGRLMVLQRCECISFLLKVCGNMGFDVSLLQRARLIRTMYGIGTGAEERVELRAPAGRKRKWLRAAERAGVSLSSWARRHLDQVADEQLGSDDEPAPPAAEDIREALGVAGALKARGLRGRVHAARETPWTVG